MWSGVGARCVVVVALIHAVVLSMLECAVCFLCETVQRKIMAYIVFDDMAFSSFTSPGTMSYVAVNSYKLKEIGFSLIMISIAICQ